MLLRLKNHCIETAAKDERRRIVSARLGLDESTERFRRLAEDLELITRFLENSDFRRMRSDRPGLVGGCDVVLELGRDAEAGGVLLNVGRKPAVDTR